MSQPVVGIGPVIAGWEESRPVYFVDVVFRDGTKRRLTWDKACRGADPKAKMAAVLNRIELAKGARPNVVLAHDQASFTALTKLVTSAAMASAA